MITDPLVLSEDVVEVSDLRGQLGTLVEQRPEGFALIGAGL